MTKNILFASELKGLVTNINSNLVIIRRVNANASPDVPKPLYQWGGMFVPARKCRKCKEMLENARKC
jgi:hypothetical protein